MTSCENLSFCDEDFGIRTMFETESKTTENIDKNIIRRCPIHHSTTLAMFSQPSHRSFSSFSLYSSSVYLQAVNGPLQERMIVLKSDFVSANRLPDDYDTDLESPWSNPSE